jgi:hypothetical protein
MDLMTWKVWVALLVFVSISHAAPLRIFGIFKPRQSNNRTTYTTISLSAYESASISAQEGRMAHRGGVYAYEGVGYSTVSADAALRNCCYYGQKTIVESAVVRGVNGWFACIRYR